MNPIFSLLLGVIINLWSSLDSLLRHCVSSLDESSNNSEQDFYVVKFNVLEGFRHSPDINIFFPV